MANAIKMQSRLTNVNEIAIFLQALPGALNHKVMGPAIESICSMGAKRMKGEVKSALAKRKKSKKDRWQTPTGALHASIGVKKPKLMRNGNYWGAFGVRRNASFGTNKLKAVRKRVSKITMFGFRRVTPGSIVLTKNKSPRGGSPAPQREVKPSFYAHLVDRGHGGPIKAKAYPFMEPTRNWLDGILQSQSEGIVRSKFPKVIRAEANRLRNRHVRAGRL